MALQAAADELYALTPEQFIAARDDFAARLRKAGERELATEVRGLRRPSVAAWLVNLLVRHRGAELDQLIEVGEALSRAMADGTAAEIRQLTKDRRTAVAGMVDRLEELADRAVPATVAAEVQLTLEAATADPAAATAVRSGRLVRPLRYAGFGEVADLADAVGLAAPMGPETPPIQRPGKPTKPANADTARREAAEVVRLAEKAALEAAGLADDAQRHYERRVAEQAVTAEAVERAETAASALRRQLAEVDEQVRAAREAERTAGAEAEAARRTARQAHQAAETARRRLAKARAPAS
ncbi:MAG: hypothetical protein ACR2JO_02360 [Mycobacteriales bacterium]